MALQAVFETLRHWLLYQAMALDLNPQDYEVQLAYLLRNGVVRAQVAAGHSLALGYLLAVAFGFWLYLRPHVESRLKAMAVLVLLWAGLFAAYSRGPWIGAVAIYFVTVILDPKAFGRLARAAAVVVVLSGVIALTPLGYRISAVLPFLGGSVDAGNLQYRQRLASISWKLIMNHPYFGDGDFISKMMELRQGQGIIDLVNTYLGTALAYGFVGLGLFVGFMLFAVLKGFRAMIQVRQSDTDLARLGSCLLACIAGTLLMIYNSGFTFGYEKMFYVLAGLAAAYSRLSRTAEAEDLTMR
jgi:O-antigen ligase